MADNHFIRISGGTEEINGKCVWKPGIVKLRYRPKRKITSFRTNPDISPPPPGEDYVAFTPTDSYRIVEKPIEGTNNRQIEVHMDVHIKKMAGTGSKRRTYPYFLLFSRNSAARMLIEVLRAMPIEKSVPQGLLEFHGKFIVQERKDKEDKLIFFANECHTRPHYFYEKNVRKGMPSKI